MTQGLPFTIPRDPSEFIALMEAIWDIEMVPAIGGVTLHCSTLYNKWNDANKVARAIGLARSGGSRIGDEPAIVYRFANGNGVTIMRNGAGIKKASRFTARHAA